MTASLFQSHFVSPTTAAEKMFTKRTVQVTVNDQKIAVQAPEQWSDLAVQMAYDKYMRKNDVPRLKSETCVFQMVRRVVNSIATSGKKQKYLSKKERRIFENELTFILLSQRACFNSPVWFNVGLHSEYGLKSDHANYSWNPSKKCVEKNTNSYTKPQSSACFIQSVDDDMDSIFNLIKSEAMLFKYGSGSGTNFSTLRSKHSPISTGEKSSGLISFLEIFDKSAGVIKSGGTTRRAAKMVCVDVTHPEIFDFIDWKMREEKKASVLFQNGYSGGLNGEANRSVSGQNSNNSVRVSDAFMRAVQQNSEWKLHESFAPNQSTRKVKAQDLWKAICQAAWSCADPGIQFHDQINLWNTCKSEAIQASNPCSEFMFLNNTACNLASINLVRYLDENNQFRLNDFLHTVRILILAQDILIGLSGYPTPAIAQRSFEYRPLGIGISNLAMFFLNKMLPYDSKEACEWAGIICALLTGEAYLQSANLARHFSAAGITGKFRGAFPQFKKNHKSVLAILKKHQSELKQFTKSKLPPELLNSCTSIWKQALDRAEKNGVRNAQVSALAPTGTISFIMDCETTGIEPEFSWIKTKLLASDQSLQLVNHTMLKILRQLGYNEEELNFISQHLSLRGSLSGCTALKPEHVKLFQTALDHSPQFCLSKESHLFMMAACQPFISGAISKTVNLPQTTTVDEVSDLYFLAWKLKLKSVAIYRDQSKIFQPLNQTKDEMSCMECA